MYSEGSEPGLVRILVGPPFFFFFFLLLLYPVSGTFFFFFLYVLYSGVCNVILLPVYPCASTVNVSTQIS